MEHPLLLTPSIYGLTPQEPSQTMLFGLVWFGLVWFGLVLFGLVWSGGASPWVLHSRQ
jgi:hypothetical protein